MGPLLFLSFWRVSILSCAFVDTDSLLCKIYYSQSAEQHVSSSNAGQLFLVSLFSPKSENKQKENAEDSDSDFFEQLSAYI